MKTKQIINEVRTIKAQKEAEKDKALLEETLDRFGEINDEEDQPPRWKPKTRGLKRALALERQKEAELAEQLTPSELLALEISKGRESWVNRVNLNLEIFLENEKKDNDIQRKMAKYYAMRNKIARAKLK